MGWRSSPDGARSAVDSFGAFDGQNDYRFAWQGAADLITRCAGSGASRNYIIEMSELQGDEPWLMLMMKKCKASVYAE